MDFRKHFRPILPRLLLLGASCALALPAAGAFAANDEPGQADAGPTSAPAPTASPYSYLMLPGTTFHPFGNGAAYSYSSAGCIYRTGGTESRFQHKLVLPQGAIVDYVRFFYYDSSASGSVSGFFTSYDGAGTFNQTLVGVSTDDGGYGSFVGLVNREVDHQTAPINVTVQLSATGSDTAFCGVRVHYTTDLIFANGFD